MNPPNDASRALCAGTTFSSDQSARAWDRGAEIKRRVLRVWLRDGPQGPARAGSARRSGTDPAADGRDPRSPPSTRR